MKKSIDETTTVTMAEYKTMIHHVMKNGGTLLSYGRPGVGKSQAVWEEANKLELKVCDIRLSQFVDGGDLVAKIPNANYDQIVEIVLNRLPREKGWVIFLDEFPHADISVQRACFQLIHDRRLSTYVVPEGTAIIAAGNEGNDMLSPEISSPMFDRFDYRVTLQPTMEEFMEYIATKSNGYMVSGYLKAFPENLYIHPEHGRVLATPRRWEKVTRDYPNMKLIKGALPPGIFIGFQEFCKSSEMFDNLDAYISGERSCPDDLGDQWALYTATMSYLHREKKHEDIVFKIFQEKFKNIHAEIKNSLVLDTLRFFLQKTGKSPLELMAKLPEDKRAILKSVISKYQYVSEGVTPQGRD